ncbi:MAG: redoxin domain-containing protein [Planctomycetia bacterium]|nr:redoxin domain-containing protein [Planctomycetia bacterium]
MKNMYGLATLVALVLAMGGPRAFAQVEGQEKSPLGQRVQPFELRDFRGKTYSLDDFKDKRSLVVAFLGTECPLALQYAPRLVQLSERFAERGVAFIGINSNQQDSITELAGYAKIHEIKFPLLKDVGNVVADRMGAVRTPEVFVLDQDRVVRYWGRIDDQYIVGRQRKQATREDLAVALEELLAGKDVSQPVTDVQGCRIGRVHRTKVDAQITYSKHIAPLLNSRCVECHRAGEIAPFSLTSYAEVAGWAETMLEVVQQNRMPPWHASPEYGHFSNDRRLSDAEKQMLSAWIEAGAPQGDPKDLPAPPQFAEGWRLPRIDQEIFMSETSFDVPAEGTVNYKYFVVDPRFTEDKWVQGAEVRPGNRSVVHHIILATRGGSRKHGRREGRFESEFLAATAPGAQPMNLGEGMAKLVPAGSKLVFQVHYTPNGSPQKDRSSVGLMFVDAAKVRKEVATLAVDTHLLLIPPQVPDYKLEAWHTFREDTLLLSLFPHMHLRGKAFRYEAQYPDGTKEVLLDVPRYDFAWQQTYELAEPKLLPKGTKMRCIAHYDNSPENIGNPNPNALVHWGEQTWDEMLMGFLDMTVPDEAANEPPKKPAAEAVSSNQDRSSKPDGKLPAVK